MTTTHTTTPTYPKPKGDTKVTFTLGETGTNFVRVWATTAPPGSSLRKKIDESTRNRFEVYEGPGGADAPWRPGDDFDKGGKYTFVAQEYTYGASTYGGGYAGAPDGDPSETKVGSESTVPIYVGQRMTSAISAGGDSVTLVLWVWNATIRETSLAVHGEVTPALQKENPSAREQAAMESTAVQAAVDALIDDGVSAAVGTPSSIFGNSSGGFVKEWNDHMAQASVHQTNDTDNDLPIGLASAASAKNLKDAISAALPYIRQHYLNDAVNGGTTSGRDSGNYHNVTTKVNDNTNMPLITGVGSDSDAYWALADLWRSYEAHRVSTAVHDAADSTNTLTALPALLGVAYQIFTVWAATSPTVPSTQSSGAMTLIATAGFEESPL